MFDGASVSKNFASSAYMITLPCGTCCVRTLTLSFSQYAIYEGRSINKVKYVVAH